MLKTNDIMEDQFAQEMYEYIVHYMSNAGFSPTQVEIMEHLGVSRYSTQWMLKELEKGGYISRKKGKPRAIRLCHYKLVEIL